MLCPQLPENFSKTITLRGCKGKGLEVIMQGLQHRGCHIGSAEHTFFSCQISDDEKGGLLLTYQLFLDNVFCLELSLPF